jgi:hypothetical protein
MGLAKKTRGFVVRPQWPADTADAMSRSGRKLRTTMTMVAALSTVALACAPIASADAQASGSGRAGRCAQKGTNTVVKSSRYRVFTAKGGFLASGFHYCRYSNGKKRTLHYTDAAEVIQRPTLAGDYIAFVFVREGIDNYHATIERVDLRKKTVLSGLQGRDVDPDDESFHALALSKAGCVAWIMEDPAGLGGEDKRLVQRTTGAQLRDAEDVKKTASPETLARGAGIGDGLTFDGSRASWTQNGQVGSVDLSTC